MKRPILCKGVSPQVEPNPTLKLTRYGRPCEPGARQSYHRRVPGSQSLPPRAAWIKRSTTAPTQTVENNGRRAGPKGTRSPNTVVNVWLGAPRSPSLPCFCAQEKLSPPSEVTCKAALQRLTLTAGGRTHARRHQTAVGPWDRRGHERPRFRVQQS